MAGSCRSRIVKPFRNLFNGLVQNLVLAARLPVNPSPGSILDRNRRIKERPSKHPPINHTSRAVTSAKIVPGKQMPERSGLITSAELADIIDQPDLRLFDCTTYLEPAADGSKVPYNVVPGRHTYEAGHIPNADFLDLQGEFSDQTTGLCFTASAHRCGRHDSGGC
jgi:hypothetical protein